MYSQPTKNICCEEKKYDKRNEKNTGDSPSPPGCITCTDKYLRKYPEDVPEEAKIDYMQRVMALIAEAPKTDAIPVIVRDIDKVRREMFGEADNYTRIKIHFNQIMMEKGGGIQAADCRSGGSAENGAAVVHDWQLY